MWRSAMDQTEIDLLMEEIQLFYAMEDFSKEQDKVLNELGDSLEKFIKENPLKGWRLEV